VGLADLVKDAANVAQSFARAAGESLTGSLFSQKHMQLLALSRRGLPP
jgi:hypothetical protein